MTIEPWTYGLLFATGLCAGLVDAVAGGGGILSLPVLLSIGLPVPMALGTNKLQSSFGSGTATWHYVRGGLVSLKECRVGVVSTLTGSLLGVLTVKVVDPRILEEAIPWLLAAIVVYTAVRPRLGTEEHAPRMGWRVFSVSFGLGLGFYDGFFGPGVGSFWTIAYVLVMGCNFARATAFTKVMNFTSNVGALALFAASGSIHLAAGLVMAGGQVIGARIGAQLVMKRGARLVRPLFLIMASLTVARLLYVRSLQ